MIQLRYHSIWPGFWQLADIKIWIASTVPMLVSFAVSYRSWTSGAILWFLVSAFAIYCIEIGKNAVNEVVDYHSGVDFALTGEKETPFGGGKKTITSGKLTEKNCICIAIVCYTLAIILGFVILFVREGGVFWIGAAGVLLSLLYSLPPFKLCYRGIGELTVGLTFGPLLMMGISLVTTGKILPLVIYCSLPIGFLIANTLWINEFPDYEADKEHGKRTGVVRLGKKKACHVYALLYALSFLSMLLPVFYTKSWFFLLPLLTIPLAWKATANAYHNYNTIKELLRSNGMQVQIYAFTGLLYLLASVYYNL